LLPKFIKICPHDYKRFWHPSKKEAVEQTASLASSIATIP